MISNRLFNRDISASDGKKLVKIEKAHIQTDLLINGIPENYVSVKGEDFTAIADTSGPTIIEILGDEAQG